MSNNIPKRIGDELGDLMDSYFRFKEQSEELREKIRQQEASIAQMQRSAEFFEGRIGLMDTIMGILPEKERKLVLYRMRHPRKKAEQICSEMILGRQEYLAMWRHAIRLLAQALAQERGVEL